MIFQESLHLVARKGQRHSQSIPVVVMRDIFAPVEERRGRLARIGLAIIVLINSTIAPVDFQSGGDHYYGVFPDGLDERAIVDYEAIGQFHQHFGRAGFGGMDRSRSPVENLTFANQLLGLRVRYSAGIGQLGGYFFVTIETSQIGLVAYNYEQLLPALFAELRRSKDSNPGSRFLKLPVITIHVLCVGELVRCSNNVS